MLIGQHQQHQQQRQQQLQVQLQQQQQQRPRQQQGQKFVLCYWFLLSFFSFTFFSLPTLDSSERLASSRPSHFANWDSMANLLTTLRRL